MALTVKVRYLAVLKGLTDQPEKSVVLEGRCLIDLLLYLKCRENVSLKSRFFDEGGSIRQDILVFINDVEASLLGGIMAELKDGDEITFLPSVHGG